MIFKPKSSLRFPGAVSLALVLLFSPIHSTFAAETNTVSDADAAAAQDFLRSYLQLQEELHETQLAVQKIHQEVTAAASSNSVAVEDRLRNVEKTIAQEHTEQLDGIAHLGRTILVAAGTYAGIGFLGLLLAAFLQWAAINRLAAAANFAASRPPPQSLDSGGVLLPPVQALEQSNTRLLELMDRLEQRIQHLEIATHSPPAIANGNSPHGSEDKPQPEIYIDTPPSMVKANTVNLLISKSQTLLKLDRAEAALDCLDEALNLNPDNADAWVKKGAALEHLQRIAEAIECYDRAIALDGSMTMAYLHKGSLFTRLERHAEALSCYEQALKARKTGAPEGESSSQGNLLVAH